MKSLPLNIVCVDLTKFNHVGIERLLVEYPFLNNLKWEETFNGGNIQELKNIGYTKIFIDKNSNKPVGFTIKKSAYKKFQYLFTQVYNGKVLKNTETEIISNGLFDLLSSVSPFCLPVKESTINKILEKVSTSGMESLTKDQKEILKLSSDKFYKPESGVICIDLSKNNKEYLEKLSISLDLYELNINDSLGMDLPYMKENGGKKVYIDVESKSVIAYLTNTWVVNDSYISNWLNIKPLELSKSKELSTDYILDKISMKGMESLSERELNYLKSL